MRRFRLLAGPPRRLPIRIRRQIASRTENPSPNDRLVYLHCATIFTGQNAKARSLKKVTQLLRQHREPIGVLTKQFSFLSIARISRDLLEHEIFESLPQAQLHFPEFFQTSSWQEAEAEASKAEAVEVQAEAVQEVLTSSEVVRDWRQDSELHEQRTEPEKVLEGDAGALEAVRISAAEQR